MSSHTTDPAPAAAPSRQIRPPAPNSVSEEAIAFLNLPNPWAAFQEDLPLDDIETCEKLIAERHAPLAAMMAPFMPPTDVLERRNAEIGGVPTFVLRPASVNPGARTPIFLEIHGGGLIGGGGDLAWMMAVPAALERPGETWVPDYRMPPRYPYPAALDDCVAVYRAALEQRDPSEIIVSGTSAGGNLAAALLLCAKDEGLPMPAAAVLLTPELDLTESGDSFRTNLGIDAMSSLMNANLLYGAGADLAHPYLSPLFGNVTGFPPTFLQTGTRDLFLSNTVRMHRKLLAAKVPAELHVFEAMPHGGFGGNTPEDADLRAEARRFERQHLGSTGNLA